MDFSAITPIKPPVAIEEIEGSSVDELFYDADVEENLVAEDEDELEPLMLGDY